MMHKTARGPDGDAAGLSLARGSRFGSGDPAQFGATAATLRRFLVAPAAIDICFVLTSFACAGTLLDSITFAAPVP